MISIAGDSVVDVAEAVQGIAEAVTQCKFEATYPAFDECVLNRILDVLVATVGSPYGSLLTHDHLINVFQACYRIGHYQTEKGRETSEMLTQASRKAMHKLVSTIFCRLDVLQKIPSSGRATPSVLHTAARLHASPSVSAKSISNAELSNGGDGESTVDESGGVIGSREGNETVLPTVGAAPPPPDGGDGGDNAHVIPIGSEENLEISLTPSLENTHQSNGDGVGEEHHTAAVLPHHEIVSLLSPLEVSALEDGDGDFVDQMMGNNLARGYGVDALSEVLVFVISFVSSPPSKQHGDLPTHGIGLVSAALHAAGPSLAEHPVLMHIIQEDLVKALFSVARTASLASLAGICQVSLALYVYLGRHLLLQIEALLGMLLLPLAEGRGAISVDHQQIALEGVLDFCSQPGFVRDIYLNLDCRIERSNLFEQICTLLSKTAFPVNGPVSTLHVLSLDGIMAILSSLAAGGDVLLEANDDHFFGSIPASLPDPQRYVDIWTPLSQGLAPPVLDALNVMGNEDAMNLDTENAAELARAEKHVKSRLTSVAEHFNRDQKKGFQYCQSLHLLPPTLDPASVARFMRCCPGLAKAGIGEVLGEREEFYDAVRTAFMETFDFAGLEFDVALRLFMDAFRPPGESQKIDRIMQVFGQRYFDQMPEAGLVNADSAYVLAFSVIMLNTDLHNTQNKKKMSLEDFARINRSTNDGKPMPPELLNRIYAAISTEELRISSECSMEDLPRQIVFWAQMSREAQRPRGHMHLSAGTNAALERDMFGLVWGPTLAAASVVLDGSVDARVARRAMDGLLVAARLAARHHISGVADQLLGVLAKYTSALNPTGPKPALVYGESEKARAAVETTFAIANRYGDSLRTGWRNVLDCVMRLHKVGLLSPAVLVVDGEEMEVAAARLPRPSMSKSKGSSGSLFSRAINSLISIEGPESGGSETATAREQALTAAAARSAEACRIDEVFADSKFLTGESLIELVKSTMWAGGNVVAAARTGESTDTAEMALELLITLALRNRDRVSLIWPLIHEYLAACTAADTAEEANALVERAVLGLLRVCQRLLRYKEDTADLLLGSLRLVVGLAPTVSYALAQSIAKELLDLIKNKGPYIRSEPNWQTIAVLIRQTASRPDAAPLAFEALSIACRDPEIVSAESYMPLLETCLQLIDRFKSGNIEAACRFLDCGDSLFAWLSSQATDHHQDTRRITDEALLDLWLTSVGVLARGLCREEARQIRDTSIAALHRTLLGSANLHLPMEVWVQTTRELLIPLIAGAYA